MSEKLKSRKLIVFTITFIAVGVLSIANARLNLGLPSSDLLYLVIASATYILGQGYVDAKQQTVKELPAEDISTSITNIVKSELDKVGVAKNMPIEEIIDALKPILMKELCNLSVSQGVSEPTQTVTDAAEPTQAAS